MTLHSPQVHGFFSVPVDQLHALRELATHFRGRDLSNTVVVSPDLGNAKPASAFARMLGVPVAAGAKQRFDDDKVTISAIIGDVSGAIRRIHHGESVRALFHDTPLASPSTEVG